MKSLNLRDVSIRFGEVQALDRVGLSLEPGQVTLLAGPNGSGKSTLMAVLLGLARPDTGELRVDGERRRPDVAFRRHLGYLPEAVAFSPNLTANQVLRFFASARGASRDRIDEVLDIVRLTAHAGRAVRGFSRGMLQRLGIAVAVLHEPDVLVLDEPTGALDQAGLGVLWNLLEEWRRRDRFVLCASHDLVLMERRVDQVVMLADGRLRAAGTPQELRSTANLPVRVHFELRSANESAESFLGLLEEFRPSAIRREGRQIIAETPRHRLLDILELPHRNGRVLGDVRIEEPGFDEVYDSILEGGSR